MAVVSLRYIDVDEKGIARIAGSRIKVKHLVIEHQVHGRTPEQLHESHPHITLSQIHAALAYYHDNKATIDQQIRDDEAIVERMRAENEPYQKELVEKLRARIRPNQ